MAFVAGHLHAPDLAVAALADDFLEVEVGACQFIVFAGGVLRDFGDGVVEAGLLLGVVHLDHVGQRLLYLLLAALRQLHPLLPLLPHRPDLRQAGLRGGLQRGGHRVELLRGLRACGDAGGQFGVSGGEAES